MIAYSSKLPIGLANALSLEYDVFYWDSNTVNPFDVMQNSPSIFIIDTSDLSSSLIKVLDSNPYIKVVLQTREQKYETINNKTFVIDYVYGLDIFKERSLTNNKFKGVVVGDFSLLSDKMKDFCLTRLESNELTTFGNGWPHTGNNGIARNPYQIFENAEYVIYPYNKPSDELVESLYYNNHVYSELDNDYTISIARRLVDCRIRYTQDTISKKYNYVSICDKMCNFLNLPKNNFTKKLEKNVSNS